MGPQYALTLPQKSKSGSTLFIKNCKCKSWDAYNQGYQQSTAKNTVGWGKFDFIT